MGEVVELFPKKNYNIVLYTRESCQRCTEVKEFLNKKNISYEEKDIDAGVTRQTLLDQYPSLKELPVVFVDDIIIGGKTELFEMVENRKMDR